MSKYRFKTKEEFIEDGLWSSIGTPLHWSSHKSMNEYLGQDIPDVYVDNIENGESFYIKSWTFRANNCILKKPVTKFKKGDNVKVISVIASSKEWAKIGEVDVDFNIGDIITVIDSTEYSIKTKNYGNWYPLSMFEKYNKPVKEYTIKDFVVGQSVKVIATDASSVHWAPMGKIGVKYNIGDILIVSEIRKGLKFTCSAGYSYPACMFEPLPISKDIPDDVISAPNSLVGKYFKVVKKTFREDLPIGFSDKIIKDDIGFIYRELNPKDCITKDRIINGEIIISDYPFSPYSDSTDKYIVDHSGFEKSSIISHNPCSEIEMPMTESSESYLDSSKKTIPNPREIILIKPISIKKRLKL